MTSARDSRASTPAPAPETSSVAGFGIGATLVTALIACVCGNSLADVTDSETIRSITQWTIFVLLVLAAVVLGGYLVAALPSQPLSLQVIAPLNVALISAGVVWWFFDGTRDQAIAAVVAAIGLAPVTAVLCGRPRPERDKVRNLPAAVLLTVAAILIPLGALLTFGFLATDDADVAALHGELTAVRPEAGCAGVARTSEEAIVECRAEWDDGAGAVHADTEELADPDDETSNDVYYGAELIDEFYAFVLDDHAYSYEAVGWPSPWAPYNSYLVWGWLLLPAGVAALIALARTRWYRHGSQPRR
ncbi:MAG: hypothetical protein ACRDXX_01655 [Stackebrandtia sp.]